MKYKPVPSQGDDGWENLPVPSPSASDESHIEILKRHSVLAGLKSRPRWGRGMLREEGVGGGVGQETLRTAIIDIADLDTMRHRAMVHPQKKAGRGGVTSRMEWLAVGFLLVIAFLARWYAALHAGLEVDEPIYHNAAVQLLQYGVPSIRPAYQHPIIPFLYHPPFFFFLLAGWFRLWNDTSYLTGRMLSVVVSCIVLLQMYLLLRRMAGRLAALLVLALLASDLWLIFTNQAIYLENSLMVLVVAAIWAYWHANCAVLVRRQLAWYVLAGLLIGCVVIYKQVGGFIVLVVVLNLLLMRKRWLQHLLMLVVALLVIGYYALSMHLIFGHAYDAATLDQVYRTLGKKSAPGLNDSPLVALQAFASRYWMFFITLLALIGGFVVSITRYVQAFFRRREVAQPLLVSWALSGMLFAAGISLKSPHYLILWLIPLYAVLAQELGAFILAWNWHILFPGGRPRQPLALSFLLIFCLVFSLGNSFGFQARFVNQTGDALEQSEIYINTALPATAVVLTENYIGVDLTPAFLDIALVNTPREVAQRHVTYMALYWTQTQPVPASLGPVARYCVSLRTFIGFKDQIEVCQIDPLALQALLAVTPATP